MHAVPFGFESVGRAVHAVPFCFENQRPVPMAKRLMRLRPMLLVTKR